MGLEVYLHSAMEVFFESRRECVKSSSGSDSELGLASGRGFILVAKSLMGSLMSWLM
jgi:hypothetical protein